MIQQRFKVTAQDGTTITLQPVAGTVPGGTVSPISQIVITQTARDTVVFDIVNREFDIQIEKK